MQDLEGVLYFTANELNLEYDSVFYKKHYSAFRKRLRQEIRSDAERKIIIYLDIANYFDELSIPKLLDLLRRRIKPSTGRKMRYDVTTQAQLVSFFDFVVGVKHQVFHNQTTISSPILSDIFS